MFSTDQLAQFNACVDYATYGPELDIAIFPLDKKLPHDNHARAATFTQAELGMLLLLLLLLYYCQLPPS